MLDVIKYSPVNGKLFFAWAVTVLRPTSRGIAAGKLPAGAIPGLNSTGSRAYSLCPPKGPKEAYVVVLFALPRHLAAKPGFDPAKLRHEANETANYWVSTTNNIKADELTEQGNREELLTTMILK